ncbi:hypothetical protein quinque_005011 [Culex quinquefasciatus]
MLLLWLALLTPLVTPEVLPPTCQLSDCRFRAHLNCTLRNLTIAKARPLPTSQSFTKGHLFALLQDPTGCMFLTLKLIAYGDTSYALYLLAGNDLEPTSVLAHKFETPQGSSSGCFLRAPTYACVSHVFEQLRLTVSEEDGSFTLEDGSGTVTPGTRMEFRGEGKGEDGTRRCSRDGNPQKLSHDTQVSDDLPRVEHTLTQVLQATQELHSRVAQTGA